MSDIDSSPDMRDQIIDICLAAMAARGVRGADRDSVFRDPVHARELVNLLRDCRPLPVITALIAEVEARAGPEGP